MRDDEATVVNGIKRSINEGFYRRPDKFYYADSGQTVWGTTDLASVRNPYRTFSDVRRSYWDDWSTYERKTFSGIANHYRGKDFATIAKKEAIFRMKDLSIGNDYNIVGEKVSLNMTNPIQRYYATQKMKNLALQAGETPEVWLKGLNDYVTLEQNNLNRINSNTKDLMNIK